MRGREHLKVRVDIEVVRRLLDGVLAEPCHFVGGVRGRRHCVAHRAIEPCPVHELRGIRKAFEREGDEILAAQKEDWLASPEADGL